MTKTASKKAKAEDKADKIKVTFTPEEARALASACINHIGVERLEDRYVGKDPMSEAFAMCYNRLHETVPTL